MWLSVDGIFYLSTFTKQEANLKGKKKKEGLADDFYEHIASTSNRHRKRISKNLPLNGEEAIINFINIREYIIINLFVRC